MRIRTTAAALLALLSSPALAYDATKPPGAPRPTGTVRAATGPPSTAKARAIRLTG